MQNWYLSTRRNSSGITVISILCLYGNGRRERRGKLGQGWLRLQVKGNKKRQQREPEAKRAECVVKGETGNRKNGWSEWMEEWIQVRDRDLGNVHPGKGNSCYITYCYNKYLNIKKTKKQKDIICDGMYLVITQFSNFIWVLLKRLGTIFDVYIRNLLANCPQRIGRTAQFLEGVLDNQVSQTHFILYFGFFTLLLLPRM